MGFFSRLFGSSRAKIAYPQELQPRIDQAMSALQYLTSAHDGMWQIGRAAWNVDQDQGTITFTSPNGMIATAPVQIIGSYNTEDGTWLWSWDNQSIDESLTSDARKVQAFGQENGYDMLTSRKLTCPEDQCWELTALACMMADAQGAYRGPAGMARIFVTFGKIKLSKVS